jgi:hypothetical protein
MSDYSIDTIRRLGEEFDRQEVLRPMRTGRYEPGDELTFEVRGVAPARPATVRLEVVKFVGGGFAGQVYRVKPVSIDAPEGEIEGLEVGGLYAMKILRPPSRFSQVFRDLVYKIGFQASFGLQVSPAAARAGALWQKLIRRAARVRLGDEKAVVDILGTFVDPGLGSCGEISEWIDGRTWRYEVEDRLFARRRWKPGMDDEGLGSPEYRAKRQFMADIVSLFHEVGAPELGRQYEWWTMKSQPNALKRFESGDDPKTGLTAVDFRAGLALLPFLPMAPGDVKLILTGLARGALVQFDRGDIEKLEAFVAAHPDEFADMGDSLAELAVEDRAYRESQIDLAHNHVRLLDPRRWGRILHATASGWEVKGELDAPTAAAFRKIPLLTILFSLLGLVPVCGLAAAVWAVVEGVRGSWGFWPTAGTAAALLVVPALATRLLRRVIGRADVRRHYGRMLVNPAYLWRAVRARVAEKMIEWHRAGRVSAERAERIARRIWPLLWHLPLSVLPIFAHRMLTDLTYAGQRLAYVFVRPVLLYFNAKAREAWLAEMIEDGRKRHMLTDEDAEEILSQVGEPFIQKYLKSLAVHVCTLPITQVVSLVVALWYVQAHPELSWQQAWGRAGLILAAFQITPISPGSLVRGLYVLYLVIRERNFKDYNIAVFLGFFKYVGYLAFPIQMAYRYSSLARFMAAHWATGAVHVVPVFGEHGALLEHMIFDLFYNFPLTLRRRMRLRAEHRASMAPRRWHLFPVVALALGAFLAVDLAWPDGRPSLGAVWPLVIVVPLLAGAAITLLAGGTSFGGRVKLAVEAGALTAFLYSGAHALLQEAPTVGGYLSHTGWCVFLMTLVATLSALLVELNLPEPGPNE